MRLARIRILFIILLVILGDHEAKPGDRVKTVAVFFPLYGGIPSFQNMVEGIQNSLSEGSREPVTLLIEYLDLGRTEDEEYARHLVNLYNMKLRTTTIDLVITIAPYTYSVLKKYGMKALETVPVIRVETDPPIEDSLPRDLNTRTIRIPVKFRVRETLRQALDLFPGHQQVYVFSGHSPTDRYFTSLVMAGAQEFESSHRFHFFSDLPIDSTLSLARDVPAGSLVFVPIYLADRNDIPFSTPEIIRTIATICHAPVFPIFDSFIKTRGGVGGYLFSYLHYGRALGRISREYLQGKPLQDLTVDDQEYYIHIYDWEMLNKWDLLRSGKIPANSIIFNREPDFLYDHRWQILLVFLIVVLETILILYLIKLVKKQKTAAKHKEEAELLYHTLTREDRLSTMVELTASLSHELNQPLTAILYSAQAGKRFLETDKLDRTQAEEIFGNIIDDDKRAAELISSVRNLMKLETREMEIVDLNLLIQNTINIFHAEAIRLHVLIKFSPTDDPVMVFGDKIQLQQVILNLITNAAVAMDGVHPDLRVIEISLRVANDAVTISVRDRGPGIDPSVKDKLFQPFVTTRTKGFGIGLAVCRSIIEKHKGEIWVENHSSGGAEFSFRLQLIRNAQS